MSGQHSEVGGTKIGSVQPAQSMPIFISPHMHDRLANIMDQITIIEKLSDHTLKYLLSPPANGTSQSYTINLNRQMDIDKGQIRRLSEMKTILCDSVTIPNIDQIKDLDNIDKAIKERNDRIKCISEIFSISRKKRQIISTRENLHQTALMNKAKSPVERIISDKNILNKLEHVGFHYNNIISSEKGLLFIKSTINGNIKHKLSTLLDLIKTQRRNIIDNIINNLIILSNGTKQILNRKGYRYTIKSIAISVIERETAEITIEALRKKIDEINSLIPMLECLGNYPHKFKHTASGTSNEDGLSKASQMINSTRIAEEGIENSMMLGNSLKEVTLEQAAIMCLKTWKKQMKKYHDLRPSRKIKKPTRKKLCETFLQKHQIKDKPQYKPEQLAKYVYYYECRQGKKSTSLVRD